MSNVQHAIKKAIQLCGGKQIKLARKAGVSQNAVSKLESGASKRPTLLTAQKLSAAVDHKIPFTEFMGIDAPADTSSAKAHQHNNQPADDTPAIDPPRSHARDEAVFYSEQEVQGKEIEVSDGGNKQMSIAMEAQG